MMHKGWGKGGKIAADHRVLLGSARGNAARAQTRRKGKVPLTLAPTPGAPPPPPPEPPPPEPPPRPPRRPGAKWGHQ